VYGPGNPALVSPTSQTLPGAEPEIQFTRAGTVYLVHVAPFHWYMSVVHEVPVQPSWLPIQTSVLLSTAASFGTTPLGRATGCQLVPS
jgi:hypothetical protein